VVLGRELVLGHGWGLLHEEVAVLVAVGLAEQVVVGLVELVVVGLVELVVVGLVELVVAGLAEWVAKLAGLFYLAQILSYSSLITANSLLA
jgi:hypothetical protein